MVHMGGKRCRDLVASINSGYDSDADFIPFNDPLSDSDEVKNNDSDDAHWSNSDYKKKIRDLKMNFKMCRINEVKKPSHAKPSDAFTRFSVTTFSKVISALTPEKRKVIEDYGFGSLLSFTKCYVSNIFAQWIAHNVVHKSGDIVIDGKIISLIKESVHCVFGLTCGGAPFPTDSSAAQVR
ncbi:hypothetical protein GQ55_2G437500 [Panicum hallii var. hallii]|uniref:Uncharacterized protein n=1 Tax=Panicum hallii var. hallii TaxID=1504633 RepID=A0A2T7EYQ1_9POAL|nr:hypothetical protein GQ55_2G437500 [Panicum hallii var. hallii]